jgi:hypothetical protein
MTSNYNIHLSGAPEFTPVFGGVLVARSLILYVCFVDRCLSFYPFSFGHWVVCPSSIYDSDYPLVSSNSSSNEGKIKPYLFYCHVIYLYQLKLKNNFSRTVINVCDNLFK